LSARWLLVPVTLLLASCGGSSGTLSHAELLERADAICGRAHDKQGEVADPKTFVEIGPVLDEQLAIARDELSELRELEPSAQDAKAYAALLSNFERTIDLFVRYRDAATAATARGSGPLAQQARQRATLLGFAAERASNDSRAIATGLGLQVCSRRPG
jgi:hypothetical protein